MAANVFSAAPLVVREFKSLKSVNEYITGENYEFVETKNPENECLVLWGSAAWFGHTCPESDTHFLFVTQTAGVLRFTYASVRFFNFCPKFPIPDDVGID